MAMTLKRLEAELRLFDRGKLQPSDWFAYCVEAADAIDAHLAQPAQAVDVGAVREVIEILARAGRFDIYGTNEQCSDLADKLTRALAGEQAVDVARGQSLGMVVYHDDEHAAAKLEGRRVLIVLDPSPTPDKEG